MSCGRVHAQNSAADALDEMEYKWAAFINMLFKDVFTAGNSGRRLFFCTCFLWLHFFSPLFFFFFLFFSAAFCPGAFLAPGIFAICDSPSNSGSGSVWIRSRYDEFQQQHPVTPDECQKSFRKHPLKLVRLLLQLNPLLNPPVTHMLGVFRNS